VYDFYGAYGGMYPGSTMLVQTYPGGPLVAAVPVPMPLYTGANPGGAGSGVGGTAGGSHEMTTAFYYALGYPAAAGAGGGELATSPYDAASHGSRRNSLESYQVFDYVFLVFFTDSIFVLLFSTTCVCLFCFSIAVGV